MKEFGADESTFNNKLKCLGNLLHNYSGLNGMKDDFAKMLYSSTSNLNLNHLGHLNKASTKKIDAKII